MNLSDFGKLPKCLCSSVGRASGQQFLRILLHFTVIFMLLAPVGKYFSGFKSFAILAVGNFANINSSEYYRPVG